MIFILIFSASFLFCLPFLIYICESIIKNFRSYIKVSNLEGFHKNPCYVLGHARLLTIALQIGLKGFEAGKAVSSAARTAPFKDVGYLAGWLGNALYGLPVIMPTRVEVLKEVLGSKQFVNKSSLYYIARVAFGKGLLCSSRRVWTMHRKLLNPTFHQHLLQKYAPTMSRQSIKLVDDLKQTIGSNCQSIKKDTKIEPFLVKDFTHKLSTRIMNMLLETIMGVKEGDLDPHFMFMAENFDPIMCNRVTEPWKLIKPLYAMTKEGKELFGAMSFGHKEVRRIIRKRIEESKQSNYQTQNHSQYISHENESNDNIDTGYNNISSDCNFQNDYYVESNSLDHNEKVENENLEKEILKSKIPERKPTLIDVLIEEHRVNPEAIPVDDIIDEVMNFLLAGWDTTTWTVTIILQLIGSMPEVQNRLYQEIMDTLHYDPSAVDDGIAMDSGSDSERENGLEITMKEAAKLKYMEAVIFETLRLYPLVNIHGRRLAEEMTCTIDGNEITFPIGTEVVIDSELFHRNPRYWTDPNRFHPERFLSKETEGTGNVPREEEGVLGVDGTKQKLVFKEQGKITPFSFIPFSAGPRNCIGKAYGIMELKCILSHLLAHFKITSTQPMDKIHFNFVGTVRRTHGPLHFLFEPRANCLQSENRNSKSLKNQQNLNSQKIPTNLNENDKNEINRKLNYG